MSESFDYKGRRPRGSFQFLEAVQSVRMRLSSIFFGSAVISISMALLPLLAAFLNSHFGLPVYENFLLKVLGVLSLLVGTGLVVYCSVIFKLKGKGTPVPIEPPKDLVVSDIYKYTRNPIYLGYWLIILGEFLFFGHFLLLGYLFLFILLNHLYVVRVEEKSLNLRFNGSYQEYVHKVPRYF